MHVDFGPYGVRRSEKGWKRSTSYHPYEFLEGTAEEKQRVTASGSGRRLEHRNGRKDQSGEHRGANGEAPRRGHGGQSRSPFERVAP
jgi:hypothetical protein